MDLLQTKHIELSQERGVIQVVVHTTSSWTPLIFWMQTPVSGKLESSELKLSNLNIYPNPTRDVVNITFSSEEKQISAYE